MRRIIQNQRSHTERRIWSAQPLLTEKNVRGDDRWSELSLSQSDSWSKVLSFPPIFLWNLLNRFYILYSRLISQVRWRHSSDSRAVSGCNEREIVFRSSIPTGRFHEIWIVCHIQRARWRIRRCEALSTRILRSCFRSYRRYGGLCLKLF